MKEIDFLPEWYKNGRRRQINYRLQYIILSGVFAVMMVWNVVSSGSISNVRAKYTEMQTKQEQSEKISLKLDDFKRDIAALHEKEILLDSIDSKINVSDVLAEISFLVNERVVLSRIEMISENIPEKKEKEQSSQPLTVVKSSNMSFGNNTWNPIGNIRFKIMISGVAASGSDVAVLLCELEDSPYFNTVNLAYSRDAGVRKTTGNVQQNNTSILSVNQENSNSNGDVIRVNEFEIDCYLANYSIQK
jgi:hypothetical protein